LGGDIGQDIVFYSSFTDADLHLTAADFQAAIDWSDGHTSAGSVSRETWGPEFGGSVYLVTADHVYGGAGVYPVSVTLSHTDAAGVTVQASQSMDANVSDGPFTL